MDGLKLLAWTASTDGRKQTVGELRQTLATAVILGIGLGYLDRPIAELATERPWPRLDPTTEFVPSIDRNVDPGWNYTLRRNGFAE